MNILKRLLYLLSLLCTAHCALAADMYSLDAQLQGTSIFTPRSQSTDAARDLVGWHRFTHRNDTYDEAYGTAAATFEYTRSFRPRRLAEYFFGTDILYVTGSLDENRATDQILADYFGLSQSFSSFSIVEPRLQNALVDLSGFVGYHKWYFAFHAPIVWTRTSMHLNETVSNNGESTPYPVDYMSSATLNAPYVSFAQAMQGTKGYGDVQPLKFGKIACGSLTKSGVSDVLFVLGYDLVNTEYGWAGFNGRLACPTGSRPHSEFLFEPIVGNGKHWELGVGFTSRFLVWEKDGDQRLNCFFDFNAMHLFKTRQHRSFDFKQNCFGSRYILLKAFDEAGDYTGTTLPAINITTIPCTVEVAVQCDVVFMFGYEYNGFSFDIGYNGWVRSKEKVCSNVDPFRSQNFAFKGIQNAEGFATQHKAKLHGNNFAFQSEVADPTPPIFILPNSLDFESASSPLQLTDAIFWHLSYAWCTCSPYHLSPFVGFGGKVEFEGVRPKEVLPNKNSLSQWGFWIKGGLGWY